MRRTTDPGLVLVLPQKVGGSALSQWLIESGVDIIFPASKHDSLKSTISSKEISKPVRVLCIWRDPAERLLSNHLYRLFRAVPAISQEKITHFEFLKTVRRTRSITNMLAIEGEKVEVAYLLDFSRLQDGVKDLTETMGLLEVAELRKTNLTPPEARKLRHEKYWLAVANVFVLFSHHRRDWSLRPLKPLELIEALPTEENYRW